MNAPLLRNEALRLAALRSYDILDTPPEQAFDDLTLLAAHICQTPIALVSLVDDKRQWFKSRIGLEATETARDLAFCAHAIVHPGTVMQVPDAQADPRFAANPLVTADPHIRFYAGTPLLSSDGQAMGTLCVIDRTPRELSAEQLGALRALGRHVEALLELRRTKAARHAAEDQLRAHQVAARQKWNLGSSVRRTLLTAGLALFVLSSATIYSLYGFIDAANWVRRTHQVIEQSQTLLATMVDVETGVRGYLIGGDDAYLETYRASLANEVQELRRLRELNADNPSQQKHLEAIDRLVVPWLESAASLVELRSTQGFAAAQTKLLGGEGKRQRDELHAAIKEFTDTERTLLARREGEMLGHARKTVAIIVGLGMLVMAFLALAGLRIGREIGRRRSTQEEVERLNVGLEQRTTELAAERDRAEASERIKAAILEHAGHAIIATTPEGVITAFNPAAEKLLGYTAAEVVGVQTPAIIHDPAEVVARAQQFSDELGETIAPGFEVFVAKARRTLPNEHEWTYIRKGGTRIPVLLTVTALRDADGAITGFLGLATDISERKQAELRMARSVRELADFKAALDEHAIVATTDAQGAITYANDKFCAISKYERKDLIGQNHRIINSGYHPKEFFAELWQTIASGGIWQGEIRNRARDGSFYWVDTTIVPFLDEHLKPVQYIAIRADISEPKHAEERLRDKNEELKGFAYTVSHDLKAPLRGISGYAQELERRHQEGLAPRALFCVAQIIVASKNLDRLIEDLLIYSRLDAETPTLTEVKLPDLVQRILRDRSHTLTELGVELSVTVPPLTLTTWERGLHQVLTNLIDNAVKYSRGSKPPRLSIAAETLPGLCRISVADNGVGFDMKYHERIFGLFNRLVRASEFEGTGAGLEIVWNLLDKLGGTIRAEAAPGQGATFFVDLPVPDAAPTPEPTP